MNLQTLFNQLTGGQGNNTPSQINSGITDKIGNAINNIPGGFISGAAAGGLMTALFSNKSVRKVAGNAAIYGGTAILGGLAYKAFKNWQHSKQDQSVYENESLVSNADMSEEFQLTLLKTMIAAARADGHIDDNEQKRIFDAVNQMKFSTEMKGVIFDLLNQEITVDEIAGGTRTLEQKSEVYMFSYMMLDAEHPLEQQHLQKLQTALQLPDDLVLQLKRQALITIQAA